MEKQFSFEVKIIIAIIITVIIVGATGIFAYKSITGIVNSISEAAKPDIKLILLKDIVSDLSDAESSVKSYSIIKEDQYLTPYYESLSSIDQKIEMLYSLSLHNQEQQPIIDSVSTLIEGKFLILDKILVMQEDDQVEETLKKISQKLQETEKEKENKTEEKTESETKKSNIFNRIFGSKKPEETPPPVAAPIEEVQHEIARIKQQEAKKTREIKEKQLALTRKDKEITDKIRTLIQLLEEQETAAMARETAEAEKMAGNTNRLIAAFCVAASLLLLIVGFVIVDYTRKNNAYRKILKKAKKEAEKLARARESFLATMSHEIRTPMNAIAGFTEQVLQTPLEKEQKEQLDMVKKSADHLLRIINEVLDYSKLEAGKLELEQIGFEPEKVLEDVVLLMKPQALSKQLRLSYTIEKSIPQVLIGDQVRLKQILLNIISNSIKFTEKGAITIEATPLLQNEKSIQLRMKITDTGIGIPPEKLNNIFQEFEQADTSTTRKYGGTGLGLTITRKLVELQGGDIHISSDTNKGTTVILTIPYNVGTADDLTQEDDMIIHYEHFKDKTILVADDEEYNRMLLVSILKKWGVRFTEVKDGQAAIDELQQHHYDAVLMDIRMPVMDGIEATKYIRSQLKEEKAIVPVIALTAATAKEDIKQCKAAGMNDFLSKPFKEKELYEKLLKNLKINGTESPVSKKKKNNSEKVITKNEPQINTPKFDLAELYKVANGDSDFVGEMIQVFIRTTREGIEDIKKEVKSKAWESVANSAHKTAAPCRHLEISGMLKLIKEIEDRARNRADTKQIPHLVRQLEEEANILLPLLEKEIEKKGTPALNIS